MGLSLLEGSPEHGHGGFPLGFPSKPTNHGLPRTKDTANRKPNVPLSQGTAPENWLIPGCLTGV